MLGQEKRAAAGINFFSVSLFGLLRGLEAVAEECPGLDWVGVL